MDRQLVYGSPKKRFALSDGIATLRDAVLLIVAAIGGYFLEGGLGPELEMAIVVILFAVGKAAWKWWTDTQRVYPL